MRPHDLFFSAVLLFSSAIAEDVSAQAMDDPAITYQKSFFIEIKNPVNFKREKEPVAILLKDIVSKYPDFNKMFFRLSDCDAPFEPTDIPSQIRMTPDAGAEADEIVFQTDLASNEVKKIEVQYNPKGAFNADYPVKTFSTDIWYRPGENLAWESGFAAYRTYNGVVDFWGKTYSHLRLDGLLQDSYHHERIWGIDPYMIGKKPGIGGVIFFKKGEMIKAYGADAGKIIYRATGNGAVSSGGVAKGDFFHSYYWIFADSYENHVRTVADFGKEISSDDILIAPGMQKFVNAQIIKNEREGYIIAWGSPEKEYGIIGTALLWNPEKSAGFYENEDGIFVKLKADNNFSAEYESVAVWNRASSTLPDSPKKFEEYIKNLAEKFRNQLTVNLK